MTENNLSIRAGEVLPSIEGDENTVLYYKTVSDIQGESGFYTLTSNNTWVRQGSRIISRQGFSTICENTDSEATLFSVNVPGGSMNDQGILHVVITGGWINNTGEDQSVRAIIKLGNTTIFDSVICNITSMPFEKAFSLDLYVNNDSNSGISFLSGLANIGRTTVAVNPFALGSNEILASCVLAEAPSGIDISIDQPFEVKVQLSTATEGSVLRRIMSYAEII